VSQIDKALARDREILGYFQLMGDSGVTVTESDQGPEQEDIDSSSTTYLSQAFLSRFR